MNRIAEDILMHVGVGHDDDPPGRGSGRHPWGSGDNPYQHATGFIARYDELRKQVPKLTQKQIAEELGLKSTGQLRAKVTNARDEIWLTKAKRARALRAEGKSLQEIASAMGYKNDSSIRSFLDEDAFKRKEQVKTTSDYLKQIVDKKGMVDVGTGVEKELRISKERLTAALESLQDQGYHVYKRNVEQATNPGKDTIVRVLCPPGTEYKDIYKNADKINSVMDYDYILTEDGSKIRPAFAYPASMDSKRLKIRYAEDGGIDKDGVVELRRGVKDLSLEGTHYAQVRILVDGTHFIKGMAMYGDDADFPDGVDVIFNTNKKRGTPPLGEDKDNTVLKKIKKDPENPFGSLIKPQEKGGQYYYIDENGNEKLGLINKRSDEGDWDTWSDKLPSQFLSKQTKELVDKQLGITMVEKKAEHDQIISLTNTAVKRRMLETFANDCDTAAVHLNAASLPRQKYQIILPLKTINDNEVYAPNYNPGEKVALIRYPHGGRFEIPILTVNNKNKEGIEKIGRNPLDAIGINSKNANILSGADFDGDTVMVIPVNGRTRIKGRNSIYSEALLKLQDFDPKIEYGPGSTTKPYKRMTNTQNEMGIISNLITDMTVAAAPGDHVARAIKHSMVVIDAEKHGLDYMRSYQENGIAELKRIYQGRTENGKYREGSATIISRAKSPIQVDKRQGMPKVNKDGSLSWKTADDLYYYDKKGKLKKRTQESTLMAETKDARTLSSGTPIEESYATYANYMKSLANQSRKEAMSLKTEPVNPSAKETYKKEVASLNAKLNNAEKNAPRERLAQIRTAAEVEAKYPKYEKLTKDEKKDKKKYSQMRLTANRTKVGAKRNPIEIEDKEWEAIQAHAVPETTLKRIFNHTDLDKLRERATPLYSGSIPEWKKTAIRSMANSKGYGVSNAEIAERFGVSVSTVVRLLKGSE